jgi:[protein-PII] uridylyltransferase
VRTLSECLAEAGNDITIQTNLLESRLLAGDAGALRRFRAASTAHLDPARLLRGQAPRTEAPAWPVRRPRPAAGTQLKESPGGLRDVADHVWVCRPPDCRRIFRRRWRAGLLRPAKPAC